MREIRTAQPEGPYVISGYCAAAFAAHAVAARIRESQEGVSLVLIDPPLPGPYSKPIDLGFLLSRLTGITSPRVALTNDQELEAELRRRLAQLQEQGKVPADVDYGYALRYLKAWFAYLQVSQEYIPGQSDCDLSAIFITDPENNRDDVTAREHAWLAAGRPSRSHHLQGRHNSLLENPAIFRILDNAGAHF